MQLVSYRNTMNGAKLIPVHSPEDAAESKLAFLEKRQAELSAELKTLVQKREKVLAKMSYDRKRDELIRRRQRHDFEQEVTLHELHISELLEIVRKLSFKKVAGAKVAAAEVVTKRICKALKISTAELVSDRRDYAVTFARHAICYWGARRCGMSAKQTAQFLGGMDHTTVLYGRRMYVRKRAHMNRKLRAI
jgi:chromosomal replication initiation ATPase DnaA